MFMKVLNNFSDMRKCASIIISEKKVEYKIAYTV